MDMFQQVDEELHEERMRKLWSENRDWIIGGLVALFAVLIAWELWQNYRESQDHAASDRFFVAWENFEKDQGEASSEALNGLVEEHDGHGYAVLGRMVQARLHAEAGRTEEALQSLLALAGDSNTPLAVVDLAYLNAAYLTADEADRALDYLKRMGEKSAFRAQSLELKGLLAGKQGNSGEALNLYREALKLNPTGAIRERLNKRIERLGGVEEEAKAS